MRLSVCDYEWELEGDLSTSVFFDLEFSGKVNGLGLDELELKSVTAKCVTFANRGSDIVCDGTGMTGRRPNPDLPPVLLSWFANRFRDEWDARQSLREEFREKLEQEAIDRHYELLAA